MKKIVDRYSRLVSFHPYAVLIIFLVFSTVMFVGMQNLETQEQDYQDMLPENYEVIKGGHF